MHIMLVISSLGPGGAERVLSQMANYWQTRGNAITLVTLDSIQSDFYPLNPGIQRIALGLKKDSEGIFRALGNNIQRIVSLRNAFRRSAPHVVISFIDTVNVLTIVAGMGLHIPIIVSERTDPRHHRIGGPWQRLRRILYPKAAAVVVQTPGVCTWIRNEMPRVNAVNIPNPARTALGGRNDEFVFPIGHNVVAIGRLSREKGFDLSIEAFAQCAAEFPAWNLIIFGEGNERVSLESLVAKHTLGHRIYLPGLIREPMLVLPTADIFVLSSHFEGFPNALIEAMACGLAAIATDCPSGPGEIIQNYSNGILVPLNNVDELAKAMKALMGDALLRKTLGQKASEVKNRFSEEKVLAKWEDLLDQLTQN